MAESWTRQAHARMTEILREGDLAIDATAGNGGDTEFLARRVGPRGKVWSCDLQPVALERTRVRLDEAGLGGWCELIAGCHSELVERVGSDRLRTIRAIMFNLGYLPRSDHAVVTQGETTCRALEAASRLLAPGGRLTIVVYRGHVGGPAESSAVEGWLATLDSGDWGVERFGLIEGEAPWLAVVDRRGEGG